jgi:hypothetical protein
MVKTIRRAGIAIGSLVIAWLGVSLLAALVLPIVGVAYTPSGPGASTTANALVWVASLVVGGLIYRDIIRREKPSA